MVDSSCGIDCADHLYVRTRVLPHRMSNSRSGARSSKPRCPRSSRGCTRPSSSPSPSLSAASHDGSLCQLRMTFVCMHRNNFAEACGIMNPNRDHDRKRTHAPFLHSFQFIWSAVRCWSMLVCVGLATAALCYIDERIDRACICKCVAVSRCMR
jgi:hypothetical protein